MQRQQHRQTLHDLSDISHSDVLPLLTCQWSRGSVASKCELLYWLGPPRPAWGALKI